MKRFKIFRGGGFCIALLVMIMAAPGAFAQATYSFGAVDGTATDCTVATAPCSIDNAIAAAPSDTVLILIRRAGQTVTVSSDVTVETAGVTFGVYERGGTTPVKGTIRFTGAVTIGTTNPTLRVHKDATVEYSKFTAEGNFTIPKLSTTRDLEIDLVEGTARAILTVDTLTVNAGDTLTIDENVILRPRLSARDLPIFDDPSTLKRNPKQVGKFEVKGMIDGEGTIFLAHTDENGTPNERFVDPDSIAVDASDELQRRIFRLHDEGHYKPDEGGVTASDCVMINGGGVIKSTLQVNASGNVCVSLTEVASLTGTGSTQTSSGTQDSVSTNLIFRTPITVTGDVHHAGDVRIVFEQNVIIEGDVSLDGRSPDGSPFGLTQLDDFGAVNTIPESFVRFNSSQTPSKGFSKNFGVHFEGASNTIEGDLLLRTRLSDTETDDDDLYNLGVHFFADSDTDSGKEFVTTVEGDVVYQSNSGEANVASGQIFLHADTTLADDKVPAVHHLLVEGDVLIENAGNPQVPGLFTFDVPAKSTLSGDDLCTAPGLTKGGQIILSGDVFLAGHTLEVPSLVIADDVEIVSSGGTLEVETVHIADGGQLETEGHVEITGALVLEGDGIDGTLASGSNIDYLTYATIDSDEISLGDLTALSMSIGTGRELRISDAVTVENLGLCSGSMVLVATGNDDPSVEVTEEIEISDGILTLDTNRPGDIGSDTDKYALTYVTASERTATATELKEADSLTVNHKDAVIILDKAVTLSGGVTIEKGHLHLKGDGSHLVLGSATATAAANLTINEGEFHTNGNNAQVYGAVTVGDAKKMAKVMTDGGELHVLGTFANKNLTNASAVATLGENGMIDVGSGALQVGPETTNPVNGLVLDWGNPALAHDVDSNNHDGARPHVQLNVHEKAKVTGLIRVPKGSKQTVLIGKSFETIVFDGTRTPKASGSVENWAGTLYLNGTAADKDFMVDSLSASNGAVEFVRSKKATVAKDVVTNSAQVYQQINALEFAGDLHLSGDGGFSSRGGAADARKSVMVKGDFSLDTAKKGNANAGTPSGHAFFSEFTDLTVMGDFTTSGAGEASVFSTSPTTNIHLHGGFDFGLAKKNHTLTANLEFSGKTAQSVSTSAINLHHVEINGAGITLGSNVMQAATADLTLTKGHISGDSTWLIKNPAIEDNLINRLNAQTGLRCGDDADEQCNSVIKKGSRNSLISASLSRHIQHGNDGDNATAAGGYLFPVGVTTDSETYYRPVVVQLPQDLPEETPVTVSPTTPGGEVAWPTDGIRAQGATSGSFLTLDVYSPDMFWEVNLGEEADPLPVDLNLRFAATGLSNVSNAAGIRIVQWDCDWTNPRLAGRYETAEAGTFAANGFIGRALNVTQVAVNVETCSIFGVAANSFENPIDKEQFNGIAHVQFIHNAVLPAPVNLDLDGANIAENLGIQSATGYLRIGAGAHEAVIQPAGAPSSSAIKVPFTAEDGKRYAAIAHGGGATGATVKVKLLETRSAATTSSKVDVVFVHGSADLGAVRLNRYNILSDLRSDQPTRLLAANFGFDDASPYRELDADFHRIEVVSNGETVAVYDVDLSGYAGETLVMNLSKAKANLELYGVDIRGETVTVAVSTDSESEITELPTEFALHGNYPNPFNPSTRIQFDLPESAQVMVQVVDMLGREVMVLPVREYEAGANRSIELDATSLASGTYMYRMIATGAESRYVKTGRMMLVK